jgi:hypothetical protein
MLSNGLIAATATTGGSSPILDLGRRNTTASSHSQLRPVSVHGNASQNIYANTSHLSGKIPNGHAVPPAATTRNMNANLNVSTNLNGSKSSNSNNASPSTNNTKTTIMDSSSNQSYHDLNSTNLSPIRSGSSASSTNQGRSWPNLSTFSVQSRHVWPHSIC